MCLSTTYSSMSPHSGTLANYAITNGYNNIGSENRLQFNMDGTVEIIPYTPAYLIGKHLLRPTLEAGYYLTSQLFSTVSWSVRQLDAGLTTIFTPFPLAAAAPVVNDKIITKDNNQLISRSEQVYLALGHDSGNYKKFIGALTVKEKMQLAQDKKLIDNFVRFNALFMDMSKFLQTKALKYNQFQKGVLEGCSEIHYVLRSLNHILEDLRQHQTTSRYAPSETNYKRFILTLPSFSTSDFDQIKKSSFVEIIPAQYFGSAIRNQIGLVGLTGTDFQEVHERCTDNPIEAAMLHHLSTIGAPLNAWAITGDYSYNDFQTLFSDTQLDTIESFMKQAQVLIDSGAANIEQIVNDLSSGHYNDIRKQISQVIHQIYNEHVKIVSKFSTANYEFKATFSGALAISWDIIAKGNFKNSICFRFREGDSAPLDKDEL